MHVVVVGAGLCGLTVAIELRKKGHTVRLIERSPRVGGRVASVYDEKTGQLMYESGPWRIPSDHRRMRAMCAKYSIELVEMDKIHAHDVNSASIRGLSIWGSNALVNRDPLVADMLDLETVYADVTKAAAGSLPYMSSSEKYFAAPLGFSELTRRMEADARRLGVDVSTDCRVVDIVKNGSAYDVSAVRRVANRFENVAIKANAIFVCVPPHIAREWTILREHAMPAVCSVTSQTLNHIYAHDAEMASSTFHIRRAQSLLAQSIGDPYGTGWFQLSYTGGRLARFWYNLWLSDRVRCLKTLMCETWKQLNIPRLLTNVRMHFWEHAYHMWVPTPGFDMQHAMDLVRQPHPFALPNVYLAGEAFSEHQAWMEGALSTAERAVAAFVQPSRPHGRLPDPRREVVLDGRILCVSKWSKVHPGGAKAIQNHMRDADVKKLWEHIHTSDTAWAIVLSLQRGWTGEQ